MSTDSKVLAFPEVGKKSSKSSKSNTKAASIVDISQRRREIITEDRRSVRRTILTEFIGVHAVIPGKGLQKCALVDISEKGLAFDLEKKVGGLKEGEELAMRVYLNHETYFGFLVTIKSCRFVDEEGTFRHGTSYVEGTVNQQALHHFTKFIESVSASLRTDNGDVMVSNIDMQ